MPRSDLKPLGGRQFGRLTAGGYEGSQSGISLWRCRCVCGNEVVVQRCALVSGNTRSCGCLSIEIATARLVALNKTHGLSGTPEYRIWKDMRRRCRNPKRGRGAYTARCIRVCERWDESFEAFLEDVGPRPSPEHSIDRIDNDGDYGPDNVRWATHREQANNTTRNRWIEYDGKRMTLAQWSRETNIKSATIAYRLKSGWSVGRALGYVETLGVGHGQPDR